MFVSQSDRQALLIPANPSHGANGALRDYLTRNGWNVATGSIDTLEPSRTLIVIDFREAARAPEKTLALPAGRVAIDYHFDPAHTVDRYGYPFHLLDNAAIIVHDEESRRFVKHELKAINPRIVLFPYPTHSPLPAIRQAGKGILYVPATLADHPLMAGVDATPVADPYPKIVTAGSALIVPTYDPSALATIRWAGASGLGVAAPATPTLRGMLSGGGILFDPDNADDFARKKGILTRPIPRQPKGRLNVAVVVPLYKRDAPGGAEAHAGGLARAFIDAGHKATLLATRTDSMLSWDNALPESETIAGIPVRRFAVDTLDAAEHHAIGHRVVTRDELDWSDQTRWMATNIRSTQLEDHLKNKGESYDAIIFIPYLYGTTFWGSQAAPERSYLVPCFHDEPHAYVPILRQMIGWMAGVFYNTHAEKRLAETSLSMRNRVSPVTGEGVAIRRGDATGFRKRFQFEGPFILYVGRMQREKNIPELIAFHAEMVRTTGRKIPLLMAGKGDVKVVDGDGVRYLGFITENEKRDAFAACSAFVLPSTKESFSIVMMEAWGQGRPVIAHAGCNVSREHIFTCGGGLLYDDAKGYAEAVIRLVDDEPTATVMGGKGRDYVTASFSWPQVVSRMASVIGARPEEALAARFGDVLHESLAAQKPASLTRFEAWLADQPARATGLDGGGGDDMMPLPNLLDLVEESTRLRVDYEEFSTRPLFGTALSKLRGVMTKHLRANYLEPLERRQSRFNRLIARALRRLGGY